MVIYLDRGDIFPMWRGKIGLEKNRTLCMFFKIINMQTGMFYFPGNLLVFHASTLFDLAT